MRASHWTLLIVPALFLQIPLTRYTEPYPAILLPAGGYVLESREGTFTGHESALFVETASGESIPIDPADLLDRVPSNYRGFVIDRGFGINRDRDIRSAHIPILGRRVSIQPVTPISGAQTEETREWLRNKIRTNLGVEPLRIRIVKYAVTVFFEERPSRQVIKIEGSETVELARKEL